MKLLLGISFLTFAILSSSAQSIEPNPSKKVAFPIWAYQPLINFFGTEEVRRPVIYQRVTVLTINAGGRHPDPENQSYLPHWTAVRWFHDGFRWCPEGMFGP